MDHATFVKAVEGLIPTVEDKYGDKGWSRYWETGKVEDIYIATVELVEAEGGSEGEGERASLVFKVRPKDSDEVLYFKKEGYYSSWDGTNWDGSFYEVEPQPATGVVYVPKA